MHAHINEHSHHTASTTHALGVLAETTQMIISLAYARVPAHVEKFARLSFAHCLCEYAVQACERVRVCVYRA